MGLGMLYSRFQTKVPTRRHEYREHNKEQEAIESNFGLELGPLSFSKTQAIVTYQYAQEWYTDNSGLPDFIRNPFSASGQLLKNANLLEREHRVYLNSKTSLHPNTAFVLWIARSVKLAGSRYWPNDEHEFHAKKSYPLKDWLQIRPQLHWTPSYTHRFEFYLDFFKEYFFLQPEQSYQSYHFNAKYPEASFGFSYKNTSIPTNLISFDLFREHHRLGDPLEDFNRFGLTIASKLRENRKFSLDTSFGIFKDSYSHSIAFSDFNDSVLTDNREESAWFLNISQQYQPNLHSRIIFSLYLSRNENPDTRSKTLNHVSAQLAWHYLIPFTKPSGLEGFKEPKKMLRKRIEYHGLR